MLAWLIYYRKNAELNKQYIDFYIEEGSKLGLTVKLILVEDLKFGTWDNQLFISYQDKPITKPDFAICRAIYPLLNKQLEWMGIPVFNNSFVAEICNDKAKTYQYLSRTGIPMINSIFYRNFQGREALSQADQPTVLKAVDGHGGKQVFLYDPRDRKSALEKTQEKILEGLGTSDLVAQPLTGSRHQDLRVYVIGKEIQAAVLRTAKEGFKSNFSLGGEVRLYSLTEQEKRTVDIIIDQFDFGLVGIDFLLGDHGELIFNEIEDVVGSRMLYQCSDLNIVRRYLLFILEQIQG
ncbi:MAG: ATP-grasp domain-containing protein [Clostridiales bacterium]|jgi:gamma-F420-2:alpha-L-glutamate ligase|nr:ATP-grasp domain-containing protein [Clostridiales bacterium]